MADSLKLKTYRFILNRRAASLATVAENNIPHVATVYCHTTKDLVLYFATRVESRKFKNILKQSTVALVFTDEETMETVQLTGLAARVESFDEEQEIFIKLMIRRDPDPDWQPPVLKLFEHRATNEIAIVKIIPLEITLASFRATPTGKYQSFFQQVI